jgi:hypothetical protein
MKDRDLLAEVRAYILEHPVFTDSASTLQIPENRQYSFFFLAVATKYLVL